MTREDLRQIAELLKPIHEELADLKDGQKQLEGGQEQLKAGQKQLEADVSQLKTDARHTRILIENQEHNIRLIGEQYGDIAEKLDKANDRAAQLDDMRERLRTLETVVMDHTAALKELRKAE